MTEPVPQHTPGVEKLRELLSGRRAAMFTTRTLDGGLASRPMAVQDIEFDGDLWFITHSGSPKLAEIEADPHVNISYADGTYLSVNGRADVVDDLARKAELWNDDAEQWFGCSYDDPSVVLIRVDALAAEYWDLPFGPSTVIALVAAHVEAGRPQVLDDMDLELDPDAPVID